MCRICLKSLPRHGVFDMTQDNLLTEALELQSRTLDVYSLSTSILLSQVLHTIRARGQVIVTCTHSVVFVA